jgi:hypothetical protein
MRIRYPLAIMDAAPIQYARDEASVNIAYWTLGSGRLTRLPLVAFREALQAPTARMVQPAPKTAPFLQHSYWGATCRVRSTHV